jgi:hypothetical protein
MTTPELLRSWQRTEGFLVEAEAQIAKVATPESEHALREAREFIEHNEFGLASDWLLSIAKESHWNSQLVLVPLALAEASMGRQEKQRAIDTRLGELLGRQYESAMPEL